MHRTFQSLEEPGRRVSNDWNPDFRTNRRDGLTLVELLVVLLFVAILVSLLVPRAAFVGPRTRCNLALNNGKQVWLALAAAEFEGATNSTALWPSSSLESAGRRWKNSTEFMNHLVTNGILDATYGFFTSPGGDVSVAGSESEFLDGELHNIWCVTLDVEEDTPEGCPVLFTQNFQFGSRSPYAALTQMTGINLRTRPHRLEAGVVIMRNGAGFSLNAVEATAINFNPAGATNRFLWPLTTGQDLSSR